MISDLIGKKVKLSICSGCVIDELWHNFIEKKIIVSIKQ